VPGKGSAFRAILEAAAKLKAKACAVVDSDLRSITPDWIDLLVRPVLQHRFDYVAPYYRRHKYDGTITNNIVYPLTRALYGRQLRQPIGGEFGLSPQLVRRLLEKKEDWETDVARFGIDIWMTTTALAEGFQVCQVFLGAKIHDPKDPGAELSAMLVQVVGSLFGLMEEYEKSWRQVQGSVASPLFGMYAKGAADATAAHNVEPSTNPRCLRIVSPFLRPESARDASIDVFLRRRCEVNRFSSPVAVKMADRRVCERRHRQPRSSAGP